MGARYVTQHTHKWPSIEIGWLNHNKNKARNIQENKQNTYK